MATAGRAEPVLLVSSRGAHFRLRVWKQISGSRKSGEQAGPAGIKMSLAASDVDILTLPIQVLDPNMDLRTVKHFIWKSGGDLTLHYRQKST